MSGRRRRTSKTIPAKGRLRDMADRLWSLSVRGDWNHQCAVCGYRKTEAHHLIPRQHQATRYDVRNGIALCSRHHKFDRDVAPHQNAAGWIAWLEDDHPKLARWYQDNCQPAPIQRSRTADYYLALLTEFRQYVSDKDFDRIVGIRLANKLEADQRGQNR